MPILNSPMIADLHDLVRHSDVRSRVAALVLEKNRVINCGINHLMRVKIVNSKRATSSFTIHAEMDALRRLPKGSRPDTVIVYKETHNKRQKNGHPCAECTKLIVASGIRKVIYSLDNIGFATIKISEL